MLTGKSSPEVVMRRSGNTDVHSTNGLPSEEEKLAIGRSALNLTATTLPKYNVLAKLYHAILLPYFMRLVLFALKCCLVLHSILCR